MRLENLRMSNQFACPLYIGPVPDVCEIDLFQTIGRLGGESGEKNEDDVFLPAIAFKCGFADALHGQIAMKPDEGWFSEAKPTHHCVAGFLASCGFEQGTRDG